MISLAQTVWAPLAVTPLLWLCTTLVAYSVGTFLQRQLGNSPLANPVLIAIALVVTLLHLTRSSYTAYFAGAQFIHFLLGPATVALAIPLVNNFHHVRRSFRSMGLALLAGSLTSVLSGIGLIRALGGTRQLALSIAPKAVTTPIAMIIAHQIGGVAELTAAMAIAGGIVAAICGPSLLRLLGVIDWRARGLAAGVAGSGVAAAAVASRDTLAAAYAALGIGLNGLLTALLVPALARLTAGL